MNLANFGIGFVNGVMRVGHVDQSSRTVPVNDKQATKAQEPFSGVDRNTTLIVVERKTPNHRYKLKTWGCSSVGERLLCKQEVTGSNPVSSTTIPLF